MLRAVLSIAVIFLPIISQSQIDSYYDEWIANINEDPGSVVVGQFYNSNAFVSYGEGAITESGDSAIALQIQHLSQLAGKINSIQVQGTTKGKYGNIMSLAVLNGSKNKYAVVTTWLPKNEGYVREFEMIRPIVDNLPDAAKEIDEQRKRWEEYSNNHDPAGLIQDLCAMDVLYINNGTMISGQEALIQEYSYMSSDRWSITLTKAHALPVNEHLVFEIGTYKSSGEGQYVLIWRKRYWDKKWVIELDSNF